MHLGQNVMMRRKLKRKQFASISFLVNACLQQQHMCGNYSKSGISLNGKAGETVLIHWIMRRNLKRNQFASINCLVNACLHLHHMCLNVFKRGKTFWNMSNGKEIRARTGIATIHIQLPCFTGFDVGFSSRVSYTKLQVWDWRAHLQNNTRPWRGQPPLRQ